MLRQQDPAQTHPDPDIGVKCDCHLRVQDVGLFPLPLRCKVPTAVLKTVGCSKQGGVTIHLQEPIPFSKLSSLQRTKGVAQLPFWECVGGGDKCRVVWCTRPVRDEKVEGLGSLSWVVVQVDCHTAEPIALWCPEWAIRNHGVTNLQHSLFICSHCPLRHMELDHVFIPFLLSTLRLQDEHPSKWCDEEGIYP